jgi:ribosomal protein S18 acetylase RimI-like enzyme
MISDIAVHEPVARSVPADHPSLREIHAELSALEFVALPAAVSGPLVGLQYSARAEHYRSAFPDANYELITIDDAAVAQVIFAVGPDSLHLVDLSVRPSWQGRGVGSSVLQRVCGRADDLGLPVILNVWKQNDGALRLYERTGFIRIADANGYLTLRRHAAPGATR